MTSQPGYSANHSKSCQVTVTRILKCIKIKKFELGGFLEGQKISAQSSENSLNM